MDTEYLSGETNIKDVQSLPTSAAKRIEQYLDTIDNISCIFTYTYYKLNN